MTDTPSPEVAALPRRRVWLAPPTEPIAEAGVAMTETVDEAVDAPGPSP